MITSVSGQLPPEENCPPIRVGIWIKVRVNFRVGGQPHNCFQGKLVKVRVWVRVSFGFGGQFSSGAIVLEPITSAQITNTEIFAFIAVLVFKLLSRKVLFTNRKKTKIVKSRLLFTKLTNFMGK